MSMLRTLAPIVPASLKPAVRAYRRALITDPIMRGLEEGHAADRQFDAGEWSDGHYAQRFIERQDALLGTVAQRFDVDPDTLRCACDDTSQAEFNAWWDSRVPRPSPITFQ